jgi:hypothetical protein
MAKTRKQAPRRAAKAEAPSNVVVEGASTTRTYADGTTNTITHASEAAAREYAKSCKGGA